MAEKIYNIKERTFRFANRIIDLAEGLSGKVQHILAEQLIRAATSIGANVEEADGTLTKKDFANKIVIARKEAKETRYWLRLISERYLPESKIANEINECQELINILSAIINKVR